MLAAVIVKPDELVVREIPEPVLGEYDARCTILYGATCTGTDGHLIHGRFPWPPTYPAVLGHESIGRVTEVGRKVRNFKVGDLVTRVGTPAVPGYDVCWGGFAEIGLARDHWAAREDGLPAEQWQGYRWNKVVPAGVDPAAATMFITWRETLSYLNRLKFHAGMSLLVVGSGGNGLSFAAHAANLGASRVGLIGHPDRAGVGAAVGVTDYYSYKDTQLADAITAAQPQGYDVILDVVGRAGTLNAVLPFLAADGMVGVYGLDEFGSTQLAPSRARGSFTYASRGYDESETHDEVTAFVLAGRLHAGHWLNLDTPYPLTQIAEAYQAVEARKHVKALIRIAG